VLGKIINSLFVQFLLFIAISEIIRIFLLFILIICFGLYYSSIIKLCFIVSNLIIKMLIYMILYILLWVCCKVIAFFANLFEFI